MEKTEIKKTIVSQQEYLDKEVAVSRTKLEEVLSHQDNAFVIILSGVRRAGKSTLLNIVRKRRKENNIINFDDNRLTGFKINDFENLYESFIELFGEENTFYFDEIQNINGWEIFVRRLHNERRKVFITGSNAHLLSRELGTHLTGRNIRIELFPFSFKEYLDLINYQYSKKDFYSTVKSSLIKKEFLNYLVNGGFPEYIKSGKIDFLRNLYENVLYRDIVARYNIRNETPLKELLHFLVSNISKPHSYNSLKKVIGVANSETVKEYISYFENSYLVFTINKFDYSVRKQLANPKKIYFIDNALANSVSFGFSENKGRQLENLVFIEIRRKYREIFYHSDKHECDFLVFDNGKAIQAIQVSWSIENEKTYEREVNGLIEAMETHYLKEGLILTYDDEKEINIDNKTIKVVPVWKWLLAE